jgi:hypothetical protein
MCGHCDRFGTALSIGSNVGDQIGWLIDPADR